MEHIIKAIENTDKTALVPTEQLATALVEGRDWLKPTVAPLSLDSWPPADSFVSRQFDFVIVAGVLEYAEDPVRTVKRCADLTDGFLALVLPASPQSGDRWAFDGPDGFSLFPRGWSIKVHRVDAGASIVAIGKRPA